MKSETTFILVGCPSLDTQVGKKKDISRNHNPAVAGL